MGTPADPNELRRLEAEAHACERNGDSLGSLDIYEEILRRGWASSKHLVALGYCYVKNRQRQNAKEIWLRALEQEPGDRLCREALDKYFPGWEKNKPAPRLERQKEMPPPPPPDSFGQELSVETTSAMAPPPRQARQPEPPEPVREARPQPRPAPAATATMTGMTRTATAAQATSSGGMRPAPDTASNYSESRVNWDFVLQDAAEEAATRRK